MRRWRLGLRRFDNAPYANLLMSHHAYWLYAPQTLAHPDPAFTHPLFWKGTRETLFPGASVPDQEQLRAETVMAIAQHDNGWWEWEATPELAAIDGFPSGLAEVLKNQREGMRRWRLGLRRFDNAPYANLLMSHHAYWLYAPQTLADPDPVFTHPLFWKGPRKTLFPGKREEVVDFLAELQELQRQWVEVLRSDAEVASWIEPENLHPHARLLQLLDGPAVGAA